MVPLVSPELDRYVLELVPSRDAVLDEMERQAAKRDIPIVGPAVGTLLSILARSIGARRVFELGSAIGYSTLFFARAVGPDGRVFWTDASPNNAREAQGYFERAGVAERVVLRVGDALTSLSGEPGEFDVVFVDIDKEGYPAALEAAAPRVRPGGLLLADNVLWSGRVADPAVADTSTRAIRAFNRLLFARPEFESVIVPLRDGVAIARKRT